MAKDTAKRLDELEVKLRSQAHGFLILNQKGTDGPCYEAETGRLYTQAEIDAQAAAGVQVIVVRRVSVTAPINFATDL